MVGSKLVIQPFLNNLDKIEILIFNIAVGSRFLIISVNGNQLCIAKQAFFKIFTAGFNIIIMCVTLCVGVFVSAVLC